MCLLLLTLEHVINYFQSFAFVVNCKFSKFTLSLIWFHSVMVITFLLHTQRLRVQPLLGPFIEKLLSHSPHFLANLKRYNVLTLPNLKTCIYQTTHSRNINRDKMPSCPYLRALISFMWFYNVVIIMFALHAKCHKFDPHWGRSSKSFS